MQAFKAERQIQGGEQLAGFPLEYILPCVPEHTHALGLWIHFSTICKEKSKGGYLVSQTQVLRSVIISIKFFSVLE